MLTITLLLTSYVTPALPAKLENPVSAKTETAFSGPTIPPIDEPGGDMGPYF